MTGALYEKALAIRERSGWMRNTDGQRDLLL
jgi:hypothetical protein